MHDRVTIAVNFRAVENVVGASHVDDYSGVGVLGEHAADVGVVEAGVYENKLRANIGIHLACELYGPTVVTVGIARG